MAAPFVQPEIFGEGAACERFMGRWSGRLAPLMLQCAGIRDGDSVLDVGSGTGALAFAVVEAMPSARVTGGQGPAGAYVATLTATEREACGSG